MREPGNEPLTGARASRGPLLLAVIAVTASIAVIAALLAPRPAEACSCGMPESPGDAFTRAEVVFVGTAGEPKQIEGTRYETTFAVGEVFRGTPGKTAVVASQWDGMSCDHDRFKAGERVLIYARGRGPLYVSGCSGTKPLAEAAADLAYLRRSKAAKIATIAGAVTFPDPSGDGMKPRANVEIRARGTKHATRTGADGRYRLELPPGTYTLEITEPDPSYSPIGGHTEPIPLPAIGTWVSRDFSVAWNGRIRGRLLDHTGQPAANVLVRAFDADGRDPKALRDYRHGPSARTDANGNYEMTHVPEGTYRVAVSVPFDISSPVPATYYPGVPTSGQARTVLLTRSSQIAANIDFALRAPPRVFTITGVVARARKSSSYPNARVVLLNKTDRRVSEESVEGADATFAIKEVEGATVKIYACDGSLGDGDCSEPITFKLASDRAVTLTLPE